MKKYGDEKEITMLVEGEEAERWNRERCIHVNSREYNFVRRKIIKAGFSLLLPIEFVVMPQEAAQRKYLSARRPALILTCPTHTVDFSVKPTKIPLNNSDIMKKLREMQAIRKGLHPQDLILEMKAVELENVHVGYIQYVSYAIDGKVLNTNIIIPMNEHMTLCTFVCNYEDADKWLRVIKDVIYSIEIIKGDLTL